jgi:ubiquinone/menaquinone biosynthesis C-methylase UbiE
MQSDIKKQTFQEVGKMTLTSTINESSLGQVGRFTQPDRSTDANYFVEFLDIVDRIPEMKDVRARSYHQMRIGRGSHVLDVGCGVGTAVGEMADLVGQDGSAEGIDVSEAMISEAMVRNKRRTNVKFSIGDAYTLRHADGMLDAVRMERVLLYVPEREKAIAEMMRVTQPGGRIVVTDVDFDCTAITGKDRALTRKMTSLVADACVHPTSGRELPGVLRAAGLTDITVDQFAVPTPYEFCLHFSKGALRAAAEAGKITVSEIEEWYRGLAELKASGNFYQLWFFVVVGGTVI